VVFDTDVLIWCLRGNRRALQALEREDQCSLSVVTYMELLQGARDKKEGVLIKRFIIDAGARMIPLTENIGYRASIYIEEYGLSVALGVADALIAATAVENRLVLCTGNRRHYRLIKELELSPFAP
jgi:predicted nucleic acid-binding protein